MIILGIETSCDETALALIETRTAGGVFECRVIQSLVHSQAELHSAYGGVFPTLAKREHSKNLVPLLKKILDESGEALKALESSKKHAHPHMQEPAHSLKDSDALHSSSGNATTNVSFDEHIRSFKAEFGPQNPDLVESVAAATFLRESPPIDLIAVTEGPGLEPALWTGIVFARMLSALWNIPVSPVDHMEGHVVGSLLESDKPYGAWQKLKTLPLPAIALLISGGHTELVKIDKSSSSFSYEIIGQTKDDAVGEAFDKTARLLGLSYPGGPHIARLAQEARDEKIPAPVKLPRPMISSGDLDFSFSGLKTAVLYAVRDSEDPKNPSDAFRKGLAREFEDSVADVLDAKLRSAIEKTGAQGITIGGGVAANRFIQERLRGTTEEYGIPLYLPSPHISGDNALMIALAGALDAGMKSGRREKSLGSTGESIRAQGTKRLGSIE